MARRLIVCLCVSLIFAAAAFAQQPNDADMPAATFVDGKAIFTWQGVHWVIPQELLIFFPVSILKEGGIDIDAGYTFSDGGFIAFHKPHDIAVSIQITPDGSVDRKREISTLQRTGARFVRNPILQAMALNGMTYVGSSSNLHFFRVKDEDAYVVCNLNVKDARHSPTLDADVGSKLFYCDMAFELRPGLYVWIRLPWVRLNDIAKVSGDAHSEILSFMH
jgi:hypothetical protein